MFETAVTSSVLILTVIVLRALFSDKINRRLRYALWGVVLLRLLMPVSFLASPVSVMNAAPDMPAMTPYLPYEGMITVSGIEVDRKTLNRAANDGLPANTEPIDLFAPPVNLLAKLHPLFVIWLSGMIAVALWFAVSNILFYLNLRKRRRPYDAGCRLRVYVVDDLYSPCLFGVFRPAVYLTPKAVAKEQSAGHVLAHELTHYAHGDHIWAFVRGLCLAVYWFNPFVWLAAILSRADSELACDETAVKRIGEDNRTDYGRTLLDLITRKDTAFMCAATTMTSGKLKNRLNMIVQNKKTVIPALAAVLILLAGAVGCSFTGAAASVNGTWVAKSETLLVMTEMELTSEDIEPLAKLTRLTDLQLSVNQISDISVLGGLTRMEMLTLRHNQISDVSPLKGMTDLRSLALTGNQIIDVSALESLTCMEVLDLESNRISDVSALGGLTALRDLFLGFNQIEDAGALGGLANLTRLDLRGNRISDISVINGLPKLYQVSFSGNRISDISALQGANLENLKWLELDGNQIRDVSALKALVSLMSLDLRDNPVGAEQLEELRAALPHCKILA